MIHLRRFQISNIENLIFQFNEDLGELGTDTTNSSPHGLESLVSNIDRSSHLRLQDVSGETFGIVVPGSTEPSIDFTETLVSG